MSASDEAILSAYWQTGNASKAGALLGVSCSTVHRRLRKHGVPRNVRNWTQEEIELLKSQYHSYADAGRLSDLAQRLGRRVSKICRKAGEFGLTDQHRGRPYIADAKRAEMKAWIAERGHPRPMLGKKLSDETKAKVGEASRKHWAAQSEEQISERVSKRMKTNIAKYGAVSVPGAGRGSWKAGWREIGDKRIYARSRWEANFARYLEHCKRECLIEEWEHEPETFWFEAIKRGVRSYLPDFRVTEMDGSITYYEVKGWMDARSKTTISRFRKYYPQHTLTVIAKPEYETLAQQMRRVIPDWEAG